MDQIIQGIITVFSLVNPAICALMFSQGTAGKPLKVQIRLATRTVLIVMLILFIAAISGARLLTLFGISFDAFKVAGGMVLVWMGFEMLRGTSSPTGNPPKQKSSASLTPLILFAASPGTITGVITLSVTHAGSALPITAFISVIVVLTITWLMMILAGRSTGQKKVWRMTSQHDLWG